MISFDVTDQRRETWICGGWNLRDDDTPAPPEPDALTSPQARRAARDDHAID